jgi:hypothetical protein
MEEKRVAKERRNGFERKAVPSKKRTKTLERLRSEGGRTESHMFGWAT